MLSPCISSVDITVCDVVITTLVHVYKFSLVLKNVGCCKQSYCGFATAMLCFYTDQKTIKLVNQDTRI